MQKIYHNQQFVRQFRHAHMQLKTVISITVLSYSWKQTISLVYYINTQQSEIKSFIYKMKSFEMLHISLIISYGQQLPYGLATYSWKCFIFFYSQQ